MLILPPELEAKIGQKNLKIDRNAVYLFQFMNSFLQISTADDFTLSNQTNGTVGFFPLEAGGAMTIGGDVVLTDASASGTLSLFTNLNIDATIAGSLTMNVQGDGTIGFVAAGSNSVTTGGSVLLTKAGMPSMFNTALGGLISLSVISGQDITLGPLSQLVSNGTIFAQAERNFTMLATSYIADPFMMAGPTVTIVVDNAFPISPLIGPGAFTMEAGATIKSLTLPNSVRIFTAARSQNTVQGTINSLDFSPGPFDVNSATEISRQFFKNATCPWVQVDNYRKYYLSSETNLPTRPFRIPHS